MKTENQLSLRIYVKAREDFQAMRKRMDNRLHRKADGSTQKTPLEFKDYEESDIRNFDLISKDARNQELRIEKMLKITLERFPVYNQFLSTVKGIGPVSAGWLLGEFDIEEATTVSKLWQYAGLNPGMVKGKKRIAKKDYKKKMGPIVSKMKNIRTGGMDYIIETDELIRGDRPMEGFVLPYNKNLKAHLLGVMAPNFVKSKSSYAIEFYYPYKARLEKESSIIENKGKARKDDGKAWKDVNPGHRDNAAKRFMVKMFLKDLYVAWRTAEGLEVRPPYSEEYLDKKHSA